MITEPTALPKPIRAVPSAEARTLGAVTLFRGDQAVSDGVETAIADTVKGKIQ